jgi:hypothetical protein
VGPKDPAATSGRMTYTAAAAAAALRPSSSVTWNCSHVRKMLQPDGPQMQHVGCHSCQARHQAYAESPRATRKHPAALSAQGWCSACLGVLLCSSSAASYCWNAPLGTAPAQGEVEACLHQEGHTAPEVMPPTKQAHCITASATAIGSCYAPATAWRACSLHSTDCEQQRRQVREMQEALHSHSHSSSCRAPTIAMTLHAHVNVLFAGPPHTTRILPRRAMLGIMDTSIALCPLSCQPLKHTTMRDNLPSHARTADKIAGSLGTGGGGAAGCVSTVRS